MKPNLHPWLSTPEAAEAARKAIQIPLNIMPGLANMVGADELHSEALAILTECALTPRDQAPTECAKCGGSLEWVRKGSKFCSPNCRKHFGMDVQRSKCGTVERPRGGATAKTLAPVIHAHIGSMWTWPDDVDTSYCAVREIGYVLCNWLRTGQKGREIPATETLANMNVPVPEADQSAYDFLSDFLESKGLVVSGDESFEELAEAASLLRGGHMDEMSCAILMAA